MDPTITFASLNFVSANAFNLSGRIPLLGAGKRLFWIARRGEFYRGAIGRGFRYGIFAGAKYRRRCRRGVSQAQNIIEGASLEQVLARAEYSWADTSVRLYDFIAPMVTAEPSEAPLEDFCLSL